MGIVINQPLSKVNMADVFQQLDIPPPSEDINIPVLRGGPINRDRGFILHEDKGEWESTIHLNDNIYLTASRDIIKDISQGEGPSKLLFTLGYAGWSAGQLEEEVAANSWLTTPAQKEIIFDSPIDKRWAGAAKSLGIDINLLSSTPGHA